MTKKTVKELLKGRTLRGERIIDIDIYDDMVDVVTISKYHTIWKETYKIINNELEYLGTQMANFVS